jgi:hypothetical protein
MWSTSTAKLGRKLFFICIYAIRGIALNYQKARYENMDATVGSSSSIALI